MELLERLTRPGPKRILALDGGGIRGAITLGYLERIETLLRKQHGNPTLLLRDYFDLIGGTSTGAIIAAALAIGRSASQVRDLYFELGPDVFAQTTAKWWNPLTWGKRLKSRFQIAPLEEHLKALLGDRLLGDPEIPTGMCIVSKRADTSSTWLLLNHPKGSYFKGRNEQIPLRKAVRASTAAPTYFVPEHLAYQPDEGGAFVDGGVSMANNPALHLLWIATLEGFPFRWTLAEDQLLLVSVGTGMWSRKKTIEEVTDSKLWNWASDVPDMLMNDATWQAQTVLQWLSHSDTNVKIDRMFGTLENDYVGSKAWLTYLRYDVSLDESTLNGLQLPDLAHRAADLRDMEKGENVRLLHEVGVKAAARDIEASQFPSGFKI